MKKSAGTQMSNIIVNYNVTQELLACLRSLKASDNKDQYEVIVTDNSQTSSKAQILKEFPTVRYFKNEKNIGFGAANNKAAALANGKYLFFLNPDTTLVKNTVSTLVSFLEKNPSVTAVSPLLLTIDGKPYQQGNNKLGVKEGIVCLSFLNKIFTNNKISKKYFLKDWDMQSDKEVDVLPGTAIMIRKEIFEIIGGFDEKFFLYFEEFDLCKRLRDAGHKLVIVSGAKIQHIWGASTQQEKKLSGQAFKKSRFYYFNKHYGLLSAFFVSLITNIGKHHALLIAILTSAFVLRIYKLAVFMPFFGDVGWFYLSAKDMLQTGEIPLVGIPSSRPWLHQGAFWTYLLAPFLWLFNYNPVAGAYLSLLFGLGTVVLIYKLGSTIVSNRTGLFAAFLYATSPLLIMSDRTPYHTSPIPLFSVLFLIFVCKWLKGNIRVFPLILFMFSVLYNFEIATILLVMPFLVSFAYGFSRKKDYITNILNIRTILFSVIAGVVPIIPMILYDTTHGFVQTGKFLLWIPYRVISLLGFQPEQAFSIAKLVETFAFIMDSFDRLIFLPNAAFASAIIYLSIFFLGVKSWKSGFFSPTMLLILFCVVPFLGVLINQTSSDAYLFILYPTVILIVAVAVSELEKHLPRGIAIGAVVLLGAINGVLLTQQSFLMGSGKPYGYTLDQRMKVAAAIVKQANGKPYILHGEGPGSQFESFTMNYQYLLWYLGNEPVESKAEQLYIIEETPKGIFLRSD